MSRYLINDDDADEIMDYLIKLDDSYAEYLAEKIFIVSNFTDRDFSKYMKTIKDAR